MAEYTKPLPDLENDLTRPYWDYLKQHDFRLQRCKKCGHIRFPALPVCTDCLSPETEWVPMSGKGRVYSFVRFQQLYHKGWEDEIPYNVAYVLLDEGIGLITNLVNVSDEDMTIDMPVEIVYDDVTNDITLLKFQPARA